MAKTKNILFTFQDILCYLARYVKYSKVAILLVMLGTVSSLIFYVYGTPTYYSRSQFEYTHISLPIASETSDTNGRRRYEQISYQVMGALNSRWLIEKTAARLGLVKEAGQYEYIRDKYLNKVGASMLPGNIIQIEVYAYQPWLVREWPEAMVAELKDSTVKSRAKHRTAAFEVYAEEMKHLKEQIDSERLKRSGFEEDNTMIERYIENNGLEGVPSEMLTAKSRMDSMEEVGALMSKPELTAVERLSILKTFHDSPVPVGTIMRRTSEDSLISRSTSTSTSTATSITSNSRSPVATGPTGGGATAGGGAPPPVSLVVVPSMVEEMEPWEKTERELRSLKTKKEEMSQVYLSGHENMRKLDRQIQLLENSIESELVTKLNSFRLERQNLKEHFEELREKMPEYRRIINDFDKYKQEFSLLSAGKLGWEAAYSGLQSKLAAMEFTGIEMKVDFDFQGFTLLRDDVPLAPNKSKLLTYALTLGVGLAAGGCIALERLKSTTSLVQHAEQLTGLSALGVVPLIIDNSLSGTLQIDFRTSNISLETANLSETFRIVRASIGTDVDSSNKCRVIMVTSSRAGEGKTSVSALLARSYAESGLRTLLIDADLRRGLLHRMSGLEAAQGLSEFLSGKQRDIDSIINPTSIDGLEIIPRGNAREAQYHRLSSSKFTDAVKTLRKKYDYIIIDTPPVLGLADAVMISPCADGALHVIRANKTSQRDILSSLEVLKNSGTHLFGFVLNGIDLSKVENYYYYSSYYPKYYDPTYFALDAQTKA